MFELDDDEKILAETKKNNFLLVFVLFFVVLILFGAIVYNPKIKSLGDYLFYYLIWPFVILLEAFFVYYIYKFFNGKLYLTNKKIIFTAGDSVKYITFDEVKSWRSVSNGISIKTVNNKNFGVLGIKNTKDFSKILKEACPCAEDKYINNLGWWAIFLGVIISQYFSYFLAKFPAPTYKNVSAIYMDKVQSEIKRNWQPGNYDKNTDIIMLFRVEADGTIKNIKIKQSSGNSAMDNSAMSALKKSSPLPKLPEQLNKNGFVDIEFTFNYNTIKH